MADTEDSFPRLLGGRYLLEAKLGHGGMGVVYRATDRMMHRPVAVKLIRGSDGVELDEEVAGRFLREAKNTARVQHEHIIEVFDLGRSPDGDLFLVMELLKGESISNRLRRLGRFTPQATVHIARQICQALNVAHSAGIIHRDLKPANVMLLDRAGDDAFVKVLDFGVAKSYSPDQETQYTHTGMLVGTVEYMAPEQIMGRAVDGRTDLYSLGVVLYRMLAGKPPFKDGGVPALIHSHLNVTPKPISTFAPDVPRALERAVLRALAKQPEARFANMLELADALAAAVGLAVPSAMPSLEYGGGEPDPYDGSDKTQVARPSSPDVGEAREAGEGAEAAAFDDATVKMDRSRFAAQAGQRIVTSPAAGAPPFAGLPFVAAGGDAIDQTAVMVPRGDESTAKRAIPEEIARRERANARPCAMCQTMNPPHARACSACGISLATQDQEAVRARVTAPRTSQLAAPPMPPPVSGAYAAGVSSSHPGGYGRTPQHGVSNASHASNAWASQAPRPPAPARPPSAWDRLLAWAGLKSR